MIDTPGQAAYEAWARVVEGIHATSWHYLNGSDRAEWEGVAGAAIAVVVNPTAADYDNAAEILKLRGQLAALAAELEAEAQFIAPASSRPDELPDIADQARAEALTDCAAKIRAGLES